MSEAFSVHGIQAFKLLVRYLSHVRLGHGRVFSHIILQVAEREVFHSDAEAGIGVVPPPDEFDEAFRVLVARPLATSFHTERATELTRFCENFAIASSSVT